MAQPQQTAECAVPEDPPRPPKLGAKQSIALDAILAGVTHTEAAHQAGVSRRTLARWLRCDPDFIAALNLCERERWVAGRQVLRSLLSKAIRAVEQTLDNGSPTARLRAASLVLRTLAVGERPMDPRSTCGPISPETVVSEWQRDRERAQESKAWDEAVARLSQGPGIQSPT
jgi:hypothetical protein